MKLILHNREATKLTMVEVPTLIDLCIHAMKDELLDGDDNGNVIPGAYDLPYELFDKLLLHLPPLALQILDENLPFGFRDDYEPDKDYSRDHRKRKRCQVLDTAWKALYKSRWPGARKPIHGVDWLNKINEAKQDLVEDWQQIYWERHLQNCMDAVAETALLPSCDSCLSEIQIPDAILKSIGCKEYPSKSMQTYRKFSNHCGQFGIYARSLKLPNVLCVPETCNLLLSSKLERLELRWIKSSEHVDGLSELLNQNSETLKSIELIHCKLSDSLLNAISDSVHLKNIQAHGVEHFSIKRSSFLEPDSMQLSGGLTSFLASGRSLSSLSLCDDHLGENFARVVFETLLDASVNISILDLSENNISGCFSNFKWRPSNCRAGSLQSLRVLNLRNNNLQREDADCLKYALVHMPNLEKLDLSDNPIEDDGIKSLITYFTKISSRDLPFIDLKLENCDLTCNGVSQLSEVLSSMKNPLHALSLKGNSMGSKMGTLLGKFVSSGIYALDIEDVGLGSSGFLEATEEIISESKLVYINISHNRGGVGTAKFVAKLISASRELVAVDARYNFMLMESLTLISSSLKESKGKLEHLDLTGNVFSEQLVNANSLLDGFWRNGKCILHLSVSPTPKVPYDDDP